MRAGVTYHVLNRGNARATVFHDATDYQAFLALAVESARRTATHVVAFCLMPNHFHFLLRPTSDDGLARWAHWLTTTHAHRYKRRYQFAGHIWGGRFKAFPVQNDQYLWTVVNYIESNAVRSGLVARTEDWPWGSRAQVLAPAERCMLDRTNLAFHTEHRTPSVPSTSSDVIEQIHHCIARGAPFGSSEWRDAIAVELGLTHTLRPTRRQSGVNASRAIPDCAQAQAPNDDHKGN